MGETGQTGWKIASEVIDNLADAGDHPLMYSFPQGAVFTFDRDLRYLSAGGLGLAEVGLSRELLEGRTIFEAFPPETATAIEPYYRAALKGISTTLDVPYEGHVYSQRLAPVRDAAGDIVAGLGFTQDVTESRRAEHALRESEQRNRLTFENAPIGEALVGLDGSWKQVNAALTELTGYTEKELLSLTFQDITHPDDLNLDLDHLRRLVAGEISSYQMEKRYFHATGRIVWVLLSVALVRDDDGTPLYFISQIQDVTERKRQQQALQDITSMLAHDLRTPAAVIDGFAEVLMGSWDRLAPDHRNDYLTRISKASRSMQAMLENALTATTLDTGRLQPTPRVVAVDALVRDLVVTHEVDLPDVDLDRLQPCSAWVDRGHLAQVLTNLLTNAAKYGGDRITVATAQHAHDAEVVVADNGPGVDPDFVPHLFDRFSRSHSARGGARGGSGLGLFIVQDLVVLNGGSVRYLSPESGGATFAVTLPVGPGDPARRPSGRQATGR